MDLPSRRQTAGRLWPGKAAVIAIVVVLLAFLAVYLVGAAAARRYEGYLSGYWVGDPGFLQRARLKDLQLFVAPLEDGARQGYLLMVDLEGNFVANQALELRTRRAGPRWWAALRASLRPERDAYSFGHAEIEYDDPGAAPMPDQVKMTLSLLDGSLTLFDGAKVYAFCTKDLVASAAAVEAYGAAPA